MINLTYVGGPTAIVEFGGLRFLTDPAFDPGGGEYRTGPVTLRKLDGPALSAEAVGHFDYVLLSHDHHFDNLDHAGRKLLSAANAVLTTTEGAERLNHNSVGLADWQAMHLPASGGRTLRVVATPARHRPAGLQRGVVNGFVFFVDTPEEPIYFSGDTVWYEGVAEVAQRFPIKMALLNLGAARVPEVGPYPLTMTAEGAVETARAMPNATIVPLHFEGWAHFSEGRNEIAKAFVEAKLEHRLRWPEAGKTIEVG